LKPLPLIGGVVDGSSQQNKPFLSTRPEMKQEEKVVEGGGGLTVDKNESIQTSNML